MCYSGVDGVPVEKPSCMMFPPIYQSPVGIFRVFYKGGDETAFAEYMKTLT